MSDIKFSIILTVAFSIFVIIFPLGLLRFGAVVEGHNITNSYGDVVAQTLESHYDYTHTEPNIADSSEVILSNILKYEDRDPNTFLLRFSNNDGAVILDVNESGGLYMKFIDCNDVEAARIVWETTTSLWNQLTYTTEYLEKLAEIVENR